MSNVSRHLKTVFKHRREVRKACFKMGLYYQGLTHDLSKFSIKELKVGFKYSNGKQSPIENEKQELGYSYAWQHHQNKNPHHWEYWIDYKTVSPYESIAYGVKIPFKYVLEMVADFIGAGKTYNKKTWNKKMPLEYYLKTYPRRIYHNDTDKLFRYLFTLIARDSVSYIDSLKEIRKNKKKLKKLYENSSNFNI